MKRPLPIDAVLPELEAALASHPALVLQASPGAGKTTRVRWRCCSNPGWEKSRF